ncbi:DNA mismatch repair protein MutS [Rhodobacteraceae bacterium RKSG542]|uniref:Smr/MutS family protein n=1 Tax=Pseudovibrio flavus TaxID=2529854 RepID=UPI0012BC14D7|nr:Smr/MutS family protein [Pseudovibrio flavus]MTI18509.1 DNA mismatch repair protein MutS [Pseudovibrio flavus]
MTMNNNNNRRRRKHLSASDRLLWQRVTTSVTPMHPEGEAFNQEDLVPHVPEPTPAEINAAKKAKAEAKVHVSSAALRAPKPAVPSIPPLVTMHRRERKKVTKVGGRTIDGRLDLHGYTQQQAHDRLRGFLHHAQVSGYSLVLVITGKGSRAKGFSFGDDRGVLRRMVPHWLSAPDFRQLVLGFEEAHLTHGGEGAIYVQIRKRRNSSRDYS